MRVAAIDCGTNSLRLLVLERQPDGTIVELTRQLRLVRLGQGVDTSGRFAPAALERTFVALGEYADLLAELAVDRVRFIATSAARDVANASELTAGVARLLGVETEIITGAQEAELTFEGAVAGLAAADPGHAGDPDPDHPGAPGLAACVTANEPATALRLDTGGGPVLVTDIGGGSTELVVGTDRIARATSLNMGSVRVRERFFTSDPPSADDLAAAVEFIDEQLATVDLTDVRAWVGVAGTCTSMGALLLGLDAYDRELVEGLVMPREAIEAVVAGLCTTPSAELVSPLLPPLRAEVIGAGALICARIAARVEAHMVVSEHDILDAVAHRLLD